MFPRGAAASRVQRRTTAAGALLLGAIVIASIRAPGPAGPAPTDEDVRLRIDPNVAGREELMLLPRIGPVLADSIIAYRSRCANPPAFRRAEDLDQVYRIGPRTVELLRPYLSFGAAGSVQVAARGGAGRPEGSPP